MLDPIPDYRDCPDCGTSVSLVALKRHRCDSRHRADQISRSASAEAEAFDSQLKRFLTSPKGQFELYYAARTRNA